MNSYIWILYATMTLPGGGIERFEEAQFDTQKYCMEVVDRRTTPYPIMQGGGKLYSLKGIVVKLECKRESMGAIK